MGTEKRTEGGGPEGKINPRILTTGISETGGSITGIEEFQSRFGQEVFHLAVKGVLDPIAPQGRAGVKIAPNQNEGGALLKLVENGGQGGETVTRGVLQTAAEDDQFPKGRPQRNREYPI